MKSLDEIYLKVKDCGPGMFSSERVLEVTNYEGKTIAGWFEKDYIENGKLISTFVEEKGDKVTILVPQYFFAQGDFIQVNKRSLGNFLSIIAYRSIQ